MGRGQDKDHVGRRLLQGFQESIERGAGEFVDLVDDVDLETGSSGGEVDFVDDKIAYLFNLGMTRRVDLQDVHAISRGDFRTGGARVARFKLGTLLATESFGEDPGRRGLARSARPTK